MMGWYPPLNVLSDSTWHMFTHVVESNQHSLHDIYVHGGLYPTHACTRCELILMHVSGGADPPTPMGTGPLSVRWEAESAQRADRGSTRG